MHLLFKQRGAGRENDNCVRLKIAKKTLASRLAPHCAGCVIGPILFVVRLVSFGLYSIIQWKITLQTQRNAMQFNHQVKMYTFVTHTHTHTHTNTHKHTHTHTHTHKHKLVHVYFKSVLKLYHYHHILNIKNFSFFFFCRA